MNQFVALKKRASAASYSSWMAAWRECKWVRTSCQCQGGSSCDSGRLALTSSTIIWGPASQLTPMLSTGLYIYLDMNEAWSSYSRCQGRPFIQEVTLTRTKCLGNKRNFKAPNEDSFIGVEVHATQCKSTQEMREGVLFWNSACPYSSQAEVLPSKPEGSGWIA